MFNFFHLLPILPFTLLTSLFVGCTEEPLNTDLSGDGFTVQDTFLVNLTGMSYQVPPEMEHDKRLYLGNYNGYSNPFALLRISYSSAENPNFTWTSFLDSAITITNIDSAHFTFTYDDTTYAAGAIFRLYYFPDGPDSIFSEKDSYFGNTHLDQLLAEAQLIEEQTIQKDTSLTYLRFSLMETLPALLDTTGDGPNYVFLLTYDSTTTTELFPFNSRESVSNKPHITIDYRRQLAADTTDTTTAPFDTLSHTFLSTADLSFIIPAPLEVEDTTSCCSVSRGKGLKSIIFVPGLDSLYLPAEATIHKAELTFFNKDTTVAYGFYLFPLLDSVKMDQFNLTEDYTVDQTLGSFGKVDDNGLVRLEIKGFIQRYYFQEIENMGLRLEPTSLNDPFETVHLSISDSDSLSPKPRLLIQYVAP